jgi:pimeloyl-ACP methyl ester carboxylesterase
MTVRQLIREEEALLSGKVAYYEIPGPVARRFFFYRARNESPGAPIVVSVHGIARNAAVHTYRLIDEAERYGLSILAPLFEKDLYGQYQQLLDTRTGQRADLALFDMLQAARRLSRADTDRVFLFGFSGGAQFSHRLVFAHPARVRSAIHVSAGWYTFPDQAKPYPKGLSEPSPIDFDLANAFNVPQHVIVGDRDIERDSSLRQSARLDEYQGSTRLERARRWVGAMTKASPHGEGPSLQLIPGVAHSFVDAVEIGSLPRRVFDLFSKDVKMVRI